MYRKQIRRSIGPPPTEGVQQTLRAMLRLVAREMAKRLKQKTTR